MKTSLKIILVLTVLSMITIATAMKSMKDNSPAQQIQQQVNVQLVDNKTAGDKESSDRPCCTNQGEASGAFTDNSIYQVNTSWTDQSGKTAYLGGFKGKKVVLSMIFASCTYACPVIVNDMKRVERALPESELKNTEFVLVSIDPSRDTPQSLSEYAQRQELDLSHWKLLTGKESEIRELAALFGFRYKKDEKGDFSHSNLINVLNQEGEIVYQHEGLNKDISDIVGQVKAIN